MSALTLADFRDAWIAATDSSYNEPFIDAGDGHGLEVMSQAHAQFERVSRAIDITTQALYTLPSSSQSNDPASGQQFASVALTFTRARTDNALVIGKTIVDFGEVATDWGPNGGVPVETGRLYTLLADLVFLPGEAGPKTVLGAATAPGWGHNNPLPGSISSIEQPGTNFYNQGASVTVDTTAAYRVQLVAANSPDMFVPEHIGQYVQFTAGSNLGIIARIIAFTPPNPSAGIGSAVSLEYFLAFEASSITGTFVIGESLTLTSGTATISAVFQNGSRWRVGIVLQTGTLATGDTVTGVVSGATCTVAVAIQTPVFVAESGTAAWRVLDWAADLQVSLTNPASPSGGKFGMLDGLGEEKNVLRLPGESDDDYRKRQHQVADVVTPNAIRRALTRTMGLMPYCFREVGTVLLPGFFYDRHDAGGDAYDYDTLTFETSTALGGTPIIPGTAFGYQDTCEYRRADGTVVARGYFGSFQAGFPNLTVMIRKSGFGTTDNPVTVLAGDIIIQLHSRAYYPVSAYRPNVALGTKRFQYLLDYADFRAFFLIGVPNIDYGEFGFVYGALPAGSANHPRSAYDVPGSSAYDGFPADAPAFYRRIQGAVDRVRAGGVGFRLYIEDGVCQ